MLKEFRNLLVILPVYEPAWDFGGGVVHSMSTLCRALVGQGVAVTVYTTNASGGKQPLDVPLRQCVVRQGVNVYYFPSTFGPKSMFDSRELIGHLNKTISQFDMVYIAAWFMWLGIDAAGVCRKKCVPMIAGAHGGFSVNANKKSYWKKKIFRSLFIEKAFQYSAGVRLTCEDENIKSGGWLNRFSAFCIPNPVDSKIFYPCLEKREMCRESYKIPKEAKVLIYVGRPDWMKRVDLLIKALVQKTDWFLVIVGKYTDGMGPKWLELAQRLKVDNRVIWTGFLSKEDVCWTLSAADLFALVSETENFGNVAVEAMMAGLPVMLSKDVGIWHLVHQEPFVFTVEKSVDSVVSGLVRFEQDRTKAPNRINIRQYAIDCFSPEIVAKDFISKAQEILNIKNR